MKNGRSIGVANEVLISKLLHKLLVHSADLKGHSETGGLLVRRRTTTVAPMDDWRGAGDLQIAHRLVQRLSDKGRVIPCIECKKDDDYDMAGIIVSPTKKIIADWRQAQDQCMSLRSSNFAPLLVLKVPRVGIIFLCSSTLLRIELLLAGLEQGTFSVRFNPNALIFPGPYRFGIVFPLTDGEKKSKKKKQ